MKMHIHTTTLMELKWHQGEHLVKYNKCVICLWDNIFPNQKSCLSLKHLCFLQIWAMQECSAKTPFLQYKPSWNNSHQTQLLVVLLTHWGRVTHICVGKLTIFGSDNGFSPERRQAIIWTNAGILIIGPLGTNFSEILIEIHFHSRKCVWKCRLENGGHFISAWMS